VPKKTIKSDKKLHKLKYWRGVVGASQADFAVLIGCKRPNYCAKENGNTEIFLSEQKKIKDEINKRLAKMGMPVITLDEIFLP
jgi:DNA-binding XRE family transcriptional regulator